MSTSENARVQPNIFREYIGFKKVLTEFPDIINQSVYDFHYILAFATEVYDETTKKGTGTFNPNWDTSSFDINSITYLKSKNPYVKVIISIGGHGSEFPFDPTDVTIKWIDEAKNSLKSILNQFPGHLGQLSY
ncbi:PREDICTED: chitinase 2-like [Lupinus angustifolius]|uniref:chitinase 2-like n=1 Tax=Lupinus angustifolius TaxID=3871 RepID=UPI00092EA19B|nr:PREDICTED: chitinase 2-like [Lupinus angustifolius]